MPIPLFLLADLPASPDMGLLVNAGIGLTTFIGGMLWFKREANEMRTQIRAEFDAKEREKEAQWTLERAEFARERNELTARVDGFGAELAEMRNGSQEALVHASELKGLAETIEENDLKTRMMQLIDGVINALFKKAGRRVNDPQT